MGENQEMGLRLQGATLCLLGCVLMIGSNFYELIPQDWCEGWAIIGVKGCVHTPVTFLLTLGSSVPRPRSPYTYLGFCGKILHERLQRAAQPF